MDDGTTSVNRRRKSAGGGYVKLHRSIWTDPDFTTLPPMAQRLYLLLISQPDITTAGVLPLTAGRWATLAPGMNAHDVRADLDRLVLGRFIVLDPGTEELWIRSYISYDSAWTNPNGRTSLDNALKQIVSPAIRGAVQGAIAGACEAPDAGDGEGDTSPHKPLAISHEPLTSSQQPEPLIGSALLFLSDEQRAAAAAAYEVWLTWRLKQPDVKFPVKLERTLRAEAPTEWHGLIGAYFMEHPVAQAEDVLYDVFRINPSNGQKRAS
jgi:hypothetical protein